MPRYFTSVTGFGDDSVYLKVEKRRTLLRLNDGTDKLKTSGYPLSTCLGFCRLGSWVELTRKQAENLYDYRHRIYVYEQEARKR